jgi:hypothetical protein
MNSTRCRVFDLVSMQKQRGGIGGICASARGAGFHGSVAQERSRRLHRPCRRPLPFPSKSNFQSMTFGDVLDHMENGMNERMCVCEREREREEGSPPNLRAKEVS